MNSLAVRTLLRAASKLPGVRAIPIMRLLSVAEIAILARRHITKLDAGERRRLAELVRTGRGRASNLSESDRAELEALVAKAEPRLFAGMAAQSLSPLPLPRRFVHGKPRATAPRPTDLASEPNLSK